MHAFAPRAPAPLVVVAGAIAASLLLGLDAMQASSVVGAIPAGFPEFTLPDRSLLLPLWPAAAGIALMSFTESIAAGRAFHRRGEPRIDPDQELLAHRRGERGRRASSAPCPAAAAPRRPR